MTRRTRVFVGLGVAVAGWLLIGIGGNIATAWGDGTICWHDTTYRFDNEADYYQFLGSHPGAVEGTCTTTTTTEGQPSTTVSPTSPSTTTPATSPSVATSTPTTPDTTPPPSTASAPPSTEWQVGPPTCDHLTPEECNGTETTLSPDTAPPSSTPSPSTGPGTTPNQSSPPSSSPPSSTPKALPVTGPSPLAPEIVGIGFLVLAAGTSAVVVARRRRP